MKDVTIDEAVQLLQMDEVVAIPTETVYGLAANIFSEAAIKKIFEKKGRPLTNPLIVHIPSVDALETLAQNIPPLAYKLAEKFWPGPLTLVLEKRPEILDIITAGGPTVAVRIPNHPVSLELLRKLPFPVAAPSANPSNYLSPTSAEQVKQAFGAARPYILDGGRCKRGIESTVVAVKEDGVHLYRFGAISKEEIEAVIGEPVIVANSEKTIAASPGMMKKHYSPRSRLILTNDVVATVEELDGRIGVLSFANEYQHEKIHQQLVLSGTGDMAEAAHNLFSYLYDLDTLELDVIVAELLPEEGLGRSVNDRLRRGAVR
ncbi:L-threonylcarbamoyladenylate synthase [Aridibaculum aurantiacum]|uniref:L-threonylcarbamoyladenylate synthase n=1 Tax=Aridibaculum aurantiacum TaxID=2810307 RepID=UPI001A96DAAB|nr:L-threonylcarbamoyladenylate synthase [Aridibaculum aurantiacum]